MIETGGAGERGRNRTAIVVGSLVAAMAPSGLHPDRGGDLPRAGGLQARGDAVTAAYESGGFTGEVTLTPIG